MNLATIFLGLRVFIALALYSFLGVIVWFQLQDLKQSHRKPINFPQAHLRVVNGESQQIFPLRAFNLIGRGVDNSVVLSDSTVSTYHARISFQSGQWWVEDLGSRNGTSLNDIEVTEPLVVIYGDKLRFGRIWMSIEVGHPQTTT